jgi:hypothetical protein
MVYIDIDIGHAAVRVLEQTERLYVHCCHVLQEQASKALFKLLSTQLLLLYAEVGVPQVVHQSLQLLLVARHHLWSRVQCIIITIVTSNLHFLHFCCM